MCRNIFLGRWLLSPFRDNGHLTGPQINYNRKHAQTRQVIERALGLLKGRWRRLKYIEMENVEEVPSVVSGACVLHNFCLIVDEGTIEEFLMLRVMMTMMMMMMNLLLQSQGHKQLPREIKWSSFLTSNNYWSWCYNMGLHAHL